VREEEDAMGAILLKGSEFQGMVSEVVGLKSGLALSGDEFQRLLERAPAFKGAWPKDLVQQVRYRSEEFEAVIAWLLYQLGNISSPSTTMPTLELLAKYRQSPKLPICTDVMNTYVAFLTSRLQDVAVLGGDQAPDSTKVLDPTPLAEMVTTKHGVDGLVILLELLRGQDEYLHRSPWGSFRKVPWKNRVELRALFSSRDPVATHGTFLDQRFIDYLERNFEEDIGHIHWRKFEELAAEYLHREGYRVELGPGSADGGVDIRAWDPKAGERSPTILVQCKRHQHKLDQVVVKALHYDILEEEAQEGLVVTTSTLSPSARSVLCGARHRPIRAAERRTVFTWLRTMRTPGSGLFLTE
jgi:restriction system protein